MNNTRDLQAAIDDAVLLEEKIAIAKEKLETLKIEIQSSLYSKMRDRNLNYAYAASASGRAELMVRTRLDIMDYEKVKKLLGSQAEENIRVKTDPKYDIKTKFKIALTALLKLDYEEMDIKEILNALGADSDADKVLLKKLKGEYKKDSELLRAAGLGKDNLEEELDAIRAAKNAELVNKYFDLASLDIEELAKAISVEDTLALTITSGDS